MANKIGRNDICPCGSGLKYKKCCMNKNTSDVSLLDFVWNKVRRTEGTVIDDHLWPYVTKKLSKEIIAIAYAEFCREELPEAVDEGLIYNNFFIPWLLFDWFPVDDWDIKDFDPNITLAQNYVKQYGKRLSDIEKRFIENMDVSYYSFYNVLEVEFEKSLLIKDILLGTVHTIKEKTGTHQLKRGDVIFSRILTMDEQSIFVGMAPFIVPARYNTILINFRNLLIEENDDKKLSPTSLRYEFHVELLEYYFEILKAEFTNPFPKLCNTDGDPIQLSKTYFNLTISPEEALSRLLPLTLTDSSEEVLENAKKDKNGKIQRITFPWLKKGNKKHKDWDNTIMGQLTLENGKLILETNSDKRMEQGKTLIVKYLGNAVNFKRTLIENIDKMLKPKSNKDSEQSTSDANLINLPEVQEQLKKSAEKHWENWFDESIPALNYKTPKEASKTDAGREMLEALLLQYERHNERAINNPYNPDIEYLKKKLGLESNAK